MAFAIAWAQFFFGFGGGGGVGGPAKIIDTSLIAPVILPDPNVLCCFGNQIRIQACGKQVYPMTRGPKALWP